MLYPAIENQILRRRKKLSTGDFVPPWKNFKTWLNNNCWEEEENSIEDPERIAENKKAKAFLKAKEEVAEKAHLEKCDREREERRQEIREADGPKFRKLSTDKLRAILKDRTKQLWITRYWLIEEILKERLLAEG